MADTPKHPPMTAREALEIVAHSRLHYGELIWRAQPAGAPSDKRKAAEAQAFVEWDRASAIMDALVEAHEAKCDRLNVASPHKDNPRADESVGRAFQKLRALERGEEPKP